MIGTGSTLTRKSVLKLKLASVEIEMGVFRAPGDRGIPRPACSASVAAAADAAAIVELLPPPTGSKHSPVKMLSPSSMVIASKMTEIQWPLNQTAIVDQLAT